MREIVIKKTVYPFSELDKSAQDKAVCDEIDFMIEVEIPAIFDKDGKVTPKHRNSNLCKAVKEAESYKTPWFVGEYILKYCEKEIRERIEHQEYYKDGKIYTAEKIESPIEVEESEDPEIEDNSVVEEEEVVLQWKANTRQLFTELQNNKNFWIFRQPIQIVYNLMQKVAYRASQLNDPIMNHYMCSLALYEIADQYSKGFDQKRVDQVEKEYRKALKKLN